MNYGVHYIHVFYYAYSRSEDVLLLDSITMHTLESSMHNIMDTLGVAIINYPYSCYYFSSLASISFELAPIRAMAYDS